MIANARRSEGIELAAARARRLRTGAGPVNHYGMHASRLACASALYAVLAVATAPALLGQTAAKAPQPAPPDVAAPPADAAKTASGLASKVLAKGTGDKMPGPRDMVTVHYTGWTTDGKMFDSSHARGKPSTFGVGQVIKGWGEGVQLMVVGEKRRLWIPQDLAYRGQPGRPAGMLVFDIELLEIAPDPTVAPPDVAGPPADSKRTASGLAYKVLKPGTGSRNPNKTSRVTVHYTGWTTDGKMFDSSVARGSAATFGLDEVIAGWTEGVQLMVEGEKTRFWIPQRLAYEGKAGAPSGMLVFDIELIAIRD
jgi:peptidylprolyl isomerase